MEFKEKTVEAATELGLKEMGLTADQAIVTVIDQGGFLKKARVNIEKKPSRADEALAFVRKLADLMAVPCEMEMTEQEAEVLINIKGEHTGPLIGYRGDVLDSVQYLASLILNEEGKGYRRLTLDCENYRAKREEILKNLARKLADKAVRTGRKVRLEPMNPAERRIIHSALQPNEEVDTVSEGAEPNRYIVIVPKGYVAPPEGEREDRRDRRDRGRRDGRDRRDRGDRGDRNGRDRRDRRDRGRGERGDRRDRGDRPPRPKKREPFSLGFGAYLGNTRTYLNDLPEEEKKDDRPDQD